MLSGFFLAPSSASAQDVWVFTACDLTEYYVQDETYRFKSGNPSGWSVEVKGVRNGKVVHIGHINSVQTAFFMKKNGEWFKAFGSNGLTPLTSKDGFMYAIWEWWRNNY